MRKKASKRRILVVEDDFMEAPEVRQSLMAAFSHRKIAVEVDVAMSEAGARAALDAHHYDICIVDLLLPWATGEHVPDANSIDPRIRAEGPLRAGIRVIEHLRRIENETSRKRTPIVLYTFAQHRAISEEVENLGFIYLEKPDSGNAELAELVSKLDGASNPNSPYIGKLLVCLFVAHDKQEDRLADFDEMLETVWLPQFGRRVAKFVYVWHAVRSAGAILKIGVITAIADRLARFFGW